MSFEMNRTWSQAVAFVQANFQLLAVIAGIFMLLPTLAFYFAMPDIFAFGALGTDPEEMTARMEAIMPRMFLFGAIALVLQMVGYMAMIALIGDDRPTVGESIGRGLKSLPTVIGAFIIFLIGYLIFMLVFSLVIALLAVAGGGDSGAIGALAVVAYIALFVFVLYVFARLSITLPVIVLEKQYNPWTAMVRAWRLTRPRAWAILGFFALLFLVYMVLTLLLMTLVSALGLAAGGLAGGASLLVMSLLYGLVGMAAAMLMSGILVSMHGQLAGTSSAEISKTFD